MEKIILDIRLDQQLFFLLLIGRKKRLIDIYTQREKERERDRSSVWLEE